MSAVRQEVWEKCEISGTSCVMYYARGSKSLGG